MGRLGRVLLLIEQRLESAQLPAHIRVNLQVARHNHLHFLHIVIYVTVI